MSVPDPAGGGDAVRCRVMLCGLCGSVGSCVAVRDAMCPCCPTLLSVSSLRLFPSQFLVLCLSIRRPTCGRCELRESAFSAPSASSCPRMCAAFIQPLRFSWGRDCLNLHVYVLVLMLNGTRMRWCPCVSERVKYGMQYYVESRQRGRERGGESVGAHVASVLALDVTSHALHRVVFRAVLRLGGGRGVGLGVVRHENLQQHDGDRIASASRFGAPEQSLG